MPFMTWNERMSVGVEVLDKDHKVLVDILNDLSDGVEAGHGKESIGNILQALYAYTVLHFGREEQLFMSTDYPDVAQHKAIHEALTKQVRVIQERHASGGTEKLPQEVLGFLRNWLLTHIMGTDKTYSAYLYRKGIE